MLHWPRVRTAASPDGSVDRVTSSLGNRNARHVTVVFPERVETTGSLDELVATFERPALHLARRILRDDGLVEDVVQEVFLAVWRRPGAFDPTRATFASWLMSMVHHKAVDVVRRESVRPRLPVDGEEDRAAVREHVADHADEVGDAAFRARVRAALSSLPLTQREVLVLAYFAATRRGRSPSAPGRRWARSRPGRLRACAACASS